MVKKGLRMVLTLKIQQMKHNSLVDWTVFVAMVKLSLALVEVII